MLQLENSRYIYIRPHQPHNKTVTIDTSGNRSI